MSASKTSLSSIRFGLGLRPGTAGSVGAEALLSELDAAPHAPQRAYPTILARRGLQEAYREVTRQHRNAQASAEEVMAASRKIGDLVFEDLSTDIAGAVVSEKGFAERLVLFWADHFTVSARGRLMSMIRTLYVDEAIRPNIAGTFSDLLIAAVTHQGMLMYLDQNSSFGPNSMMGLARGRGLNENLAREILELHTLGVSGTYGQSDVRAFAELLTGLRITPNGAAFQPIFSEPGEKTVLGATYGGPIGSMEDIKEALRDIASMPETAEHLARKLVVHFVSDTPNEGHVAQVAAAYTSSGGDLLAVYDALLNHPAAWEPELRKVKQPLDFVVSSLRALSVPGEAIAGLAPKEVRSTLVNPLTAMGQMPNRPLGPDGWPEDAGAWITPATLSARITYATELARRFGQEMDPRAFLKGALGDMASANTRFVVEGSETKWEGVALTLASPEFNRR